MLPQVALDHPIITFTVVVGATLLLLLIVSVISDWLVRKE